MAAAIYFTAGAASAYFGAAGAADAAAGGAAALGGDAGAAAGAFGATDAAAAAATGADAGFGAGVAADLGGASAGIAGAADAGAVAGGAAASGGAGAALLGESAATAAPATATAATSAAGGGSLWQSSLGAAKSLLSMPGVPSLIGGIAMGAMQANAVNAQLKYADAHAPGQITGGVKNAFGGFQNNQNLNPQTPKPTAARLPQFTSLAAPGSTPTGVPQLPGQNSTAAPSYGMPGYGTPGYGQQTQPSEGDPAADPYRNMLAQEGLLGGGGAQTPFMESPYDESYA